MKSVKWFDQLLVTAMVISLLFALYRNAAVGFDRPPQNDGEPLTPAEHELLEELIESIGTQEPETVTVEDEHGNQKKICLWNAAMDLMTQLHDSGRMERERNDDGRCWALPDCMKSTNGDGMNVSPSAMAAAANDLRARVALKGMLLHEWDHKTQDTATLTGPGNQWGAEIEPYSLQYAYICSLGFGEREKVRSGPYTALWENKINYRKALEGRNDYVRPESDRAEHDYFVYIKFDTSGAGSDSLKGFKFSDPFEHGFALTPMRASDIVVFPDHPLVPPGHSLVLLCGGVPSMGTARLLALDVYHGEVIASMLTQDFGPPLYAPMFFYSMTRAVEPGIYYMLDTLGHCIYTMTDTNGDQIPDEISRVFADANLPGFAPLRFQRGVDAAIHPIHGAGLLLTDYDAHPTHLLNPGAYHLFVADLNGDQMADLCVTLPLAQFLHLPPVILLPRPWPGDASVRLFATWQHTIEVWKTDASGEMLLEMLGVTMMSSGMHGECPLLCPLLPDEYLACRDMQTMQTSWPPMQTVNPIPQALTIQYDSEWGFLHLSWEAVPGAACYALYVSDDGAAFFDTGLRPETNTLELPLAPFGKQFYYVTSLR